MAPPQVAQPLLEACVETLEECVAAEQRGAHRLELCADLAADGLTPPIALVRAVLRSVKIPVKVMVRPREGNFIYSAPEIKQMETQLKALKGARVEEVVLGLLTEENTIDVAGTARLAAAASPMRVTFHKAIDLVPDPVSALKQLAPIENVRSVLSSGGAATALEGQVTLRRMLREAADRFTVIAAGKVTSDNLPYVHSRIGAEEYHGKKVVGVLSDNLHVPSETTDSASTALEKYAANHGYIRGEHLLGRALKTFFLSFSSVVLISVVRGKIGWGSRRARRNIAT